MDTKSISSISEFTEWVGGLEGPIMYYRGLSDASWELEASGYRRIKDSSVGNTPPTLTYFKSCINELVDDAKSEGFEQRDGKKLTDLELLAELQHNGAATCLIDFTGNPLVALWFACRENPGQEGKVLAMRTDKMDTFAKVTHKELNDSIDDFFSEGKLWQWVPRRNNNRIIAQNSVFVFGQGKIEEQYYKAINVNKAAKEKICSELQDKYNINELHLFRDFTGFSLAHAHNKPYSKKNYYRRGILLHREGDYKKAIEQYDKAIEMDPKNDAACYARGLAKEALGNYQGAIEDYSKVIEINPKDAVAYYARGLAKEALDNYQGAIEDYNKAIEINPKLAIKS